MLPDLIDNLFNNNNLVCNNKLITTKEFIIIIRKID